MKNLYLIYLISFATVLFVFSCCEGNQNKSISGVLILSVNPEASEKIYTSSIIDSIVYCPLETVVSIGTIDKVEISDTLFFLLDNQSKIIWCFSHTGRYQYCIDKRGKGPGEYLRIYDFNIDHVNKQILVLDRDQNKILYYDLNGNFVKDLRIGVKARQFALLQDHILLYTSGTDVDMGKGKEFGYNLFLIDFDGKVKAKYCLYNEFTDNLWGIPVFTANDSKVMYHYAHNDTIYEYNNNGDVVRKVLFDFGKYRIPIETINNEQLMSEYQNKTNRASISIVLYSQQFMVITYSFERRVRFLLVNNTTEKIINGSFLENDMDYISFANPTPSKIIGNKLFFIKESIDLCQQKRDGQYIYKGIKQLSSLNEESNPVVVIAYLKNNEK